jgi:tape measure domain-containing protein
MTVTAGKLKIVVEADTSDAEAGLDRMGNKLKETRSKVESDTLSMGNMIKAVFAGNLLSDAVEGVARGIGGLLTMTTNAFTGIVGSAYEAVKSYEMLKMGMTQLTATQLVQAGATKDMSVALQYAQQPAQDLLNWIEQLAVKSPFNSSDVAAAVRMAETFGFTEKEAKRLTQALIDFSSGAGLGGDVMARITMSMGQMAAAGKLDGQSIRELAMAGLPVKQILSDAFGVTTAKMEEMVTKGALPVGKALEAITGYLEKNFKGAAERATNTWQGLQSSLEDIKQIDLRMLFQGAFDAIQPYAANIVNFLGSADFKNKLQKLGMEIGTALTTGLNSGETAIKGLLDNNFLGGLQDIAKQFASGDWGGAISKLIGEIQFGAMNIVVGLKHAGEVFVAVGGFIASTLWEFLTRLNGLFTMFGNVLSTKMDAFQAQIVAKTRLGLDSSANADAAYFTAQAEQASSNLSQYWQSYTDKVDTGFAALQGKLIAYNSEWETNKEIVAAAKKEYTDMIAENEAATVRAESRKLAMLNDARLDPTLRKGRLAGVNLNELYDDKTGTGNGGFDPEKYLNADKVYKLGNTASNAGASAGKKMATQLESAVDQAINKIQGKLQKGMDVSINLGKIPGLDKMEAGAGGPFEELYRLQDVALNLGTAHEGKDTRKWYQQYYGGMGFAEAIAAARNTVGQFQMGNFSDDVLRYVNTGMLRQMVMDEQNAGASQERLAKMIGADPKFLSTMLGGKLNDQGIKFGETEAAALAQSMKDGTVKAMSKVAGTKPTVIDAMFGAVAGGSATGSGQQSNTPDFGTAMVPAFLSSVDKALASNETDFKNRGKAAWDLIEAGFVDQAKNSSGFMDAINGMVDKALKGKIPGYTPGR